MKQHGGDVAKVLRRTKNYIVENSLECQIIAGSIRTGVDVADAWMEGADIVTTGISVIREMVEHPKTTESIKRFDEDFSSWLSK